MARFLISFNDGDMQVADDEWQQVADESHAVVREAKGAGVWVFGGGFHTYDPVVVDANGNVTRGPITKSDVVLGGFSVLEVANAVEAYAWAAKIAKGCRCPQEVREFIDDPESVN
ncbi:MAG: YciI family protein [Micrococcales bacterium]